MICTKAHYKITKNSNINYILKVLLPRNAWHLVEINLQYNSYKPVKCLFGNQFKIHTDVILGM
jgi:hypothetical protein